ALLWIRNRDAAFLSRLGHQVTERTALLIVGGWPIQAVLLARSAPERGGVDAGGFAVVRIPRVEPLRGDVDAADANHRELVAANATGEHFLFARRGIESPAV